MKWSVAENIPRLAPSAETGARIFCDDREVHFVRAFDTAEGWIETHCTDGHTGHPGERHLTPDGASACVVTLRGAVHVEVPARCA